MSKLPKFLCVGAQKAGTTWLYRMMSENPNVFLPRIKELLHFIEIPEGDSDQWRHRMILESTVAACNEYIHNERDSLRPGFAQYILSYGAADRFTDAWYERIYSAAPDTAMSGDVTPEYMMMGTSGIARVKSLLGDVKIILILREPIERLWSQVRMICKEDGLDPLTSYWSVVDRFGCQKNSDYAQHVPIWMSEFASEDLALVNFHALARDGDAVYADVLNFLGLPDHAASNANHIVHPGKPLDLPQDIRADLEKRLAPQTAFMENTFGSDWMASPGRMHPRGASLR